MMLKKHFNMQELSFNMRADVANIKYHALHCFKGILTAGELLERHVPACFCAYPPALDFYNELIVQIGCAPNMYKYKSYPLLNRSCSMESIMKVGPKGQVVIPHEFRHALHIYPGSAIPVLSPTAFF